MPPSDRSRIWSHRSACRVLALAVFAPVLTLAAQSQEPPPKVVRLDTSKVSASADAAVPRDNTRSSRDVLSAQQFIDGHYENVLDGLSAMRPRWLTTRGTFSLKADASGQVDVYIDNVKAGGTDALRQVSTRTITTMQYLDPVASQARFGVGHVGGVILVSTGVP